MVVSQTDPSNYRFEGRVLNYNKITGELVLTNIVNIIGTYPYLSIYNINLDGIDGPTGPKGDTGLKGDTGPIGSSYWVQNINDIYYNTGNVSIGTSTPSSLLTVNGQITATSFNSTSDYRIKTNIKELDTNLINIDLLKPVTYFNTLSNKEDIGFIAHEVQNVLPQLVSGQYNGEINQSINYIGIIPILVKEIQDLKARVAFLENNR
jgi:hypothetical protein